jgi:4-hydroxy-3-methylbut-2-en-1-yl diphosphate synthase IspG/GcpE
MSRQELDEYRDLVICNNCLWMASLLRGSSGFKTCPVCGRSNLDIIPVADFESYIVHIKENRGIEIEFTK